MCSAFGLIQSKKTPQQQWGRGPIVMHGYISSASPHLKGVECLQSFLVKQTLQHLEQSPVNTYIFRSFLVNTWWRANKMVLSR